MSCQVRYIKHGQELLSPVFGSPKLADGYAKSVGGTVIPSAILAPPITFAKVADPKIIDRMRAKRNARSAARVSCGDRIFDAKSSKREGLFSGEN